MSRPRLWDPYLTAEERAWFKDTRQKWGVRPAILVIDIYNRVMGDRPEPIAEAVKRFPAATGERGWQAIPHVQRLLAAARARDLPIIYTTKDARRDARGDLLGATKNGGGDTDDWEWQYAIFPGVAPQPEDSLIYKTRASVFFGTPLAALLHHKRVDTVIVVGEATSCCVRHSVLDSFSHGYTTVVVEEAVWDRNWVSHCANLFVLHSKYADVVSIAEVLPYLEQLPAAQSTAGGPEGRS